MEKYLPLIRYNLAVQKGIFSRRLVWVMDPKKYAAQKTDEILDVKIYKHNSLMRRTLGKVDPLLQDNKATNLAIAVPFINRVLIRPGETFSLWRLVGKCTKARGFKEGLVIKGGNISSGVGGGMCQLSNLIHWMVLHSPLTIVEHHHHNQIDMFPDFGRTIPFGTGTSIMYNYLDYQFTNNTEVTFQLLIHVDEEHLCGELRASETFDYAYHVIEEDKYFLRKEDGIYRHNKIYRHKIIKTSGDIVENKLILENLSKVMYDESFIDPNLIR